MEYDSNYEKYVCSAWETQFKKRQGNSVDNINKFLNKNSAKYSSAEMYAYKAYRKEKLRKFTNGALGVTVVMGLFSLMMPSMFALTGICAGISLITGVLSSNKVYDKWVDFKAKTMWKWFRPKKYADYQKDKLYNKTHTKLTELNVNLDAIYPKNDSLEDLDNYMSYRNNRIKETVDGFNKEINNLEKFSNTRRGREIPDLKNFIADYKQKLNDYSSYEDQTLQSYNNEKDFYKRGIDLQAQNINKAQELEFPMLYNTQTEKQVGRDFNKD